MNALSDKSDSLHHLIPRNECKDCINLWNKRPFSPSICKTNRARESFMTSALPLLIITFMIYIVQHILVRDLYIIYIIILALPFM